MSSDVCSWNRTGGRNENRCVKNIHGTSSDKHKIDQLKQKYLEVTGKRVFPDKCQALGCTNPATCTAHVIYNDGRRSGEWFLVPTCSSHNHYTQDQPYYLKESAVLARVSDVRLL